MSEKYFWKVTKLILEVVLKNGINQKIKITQKKINKKTYIYILFFYPKIDKKNFGGIENLNFYKKNFQILKKKNNIYKCHIFSTLQII